MLVTTIPFHSIIPFFSSIFFFLRTDCVTEQMQTLLRREAVDMRYKRRYRPCLQGSYNPIGEKNIQLVEGRENISLVWSA